MAKKALFRLFRLVFALVMFFPLAVSPGYAQPPVPAVQAARLPWSKLVYQAIWNNDFQIFIANDDGSSITLGLNYGNNGLIPAEGVTITATLPDELAFVSANPPPTVINPAPAATNGQTLTWEVGSLPARSGPFTISITATVAEDAALFSTASGSLEITTTSPELETANNARPTSLFIGTRVFVPVISR